MQLRHGLGAVLSAVCVCCMLTLTADARSLVSNLMSEQLASTPPAACGQGGSCKSTGCAGDEIIDNTGPRCSHSEVCCKKRTAAASAPSNPTTAVPSDPPSAPVPSAPSAASAASSASHEADSGMSEAATEAVEKRLGCAPLPEETACPATIDENDVWGALKHANPNRPLVLAHRGLFQVSQENTLKGISAAIQAGADGVEFDIMMTTDNVFVLFHDDFMDHLIEGATKADSIWKKTYAQLQPLMYKQEIDYSHYNKDGKLMGPERKIKYPSAHNITTLEEVFMKFSTKVLGKPFIMDIEFKGVVTGDLGSEEVGQKAAALIDKYNMWGQVLLTGFVPKTLKGIKAYCTQHKIKLCRAGFGIDDFLPYVGHLIGHANDYALPPTKRDCKGDICVVVPFKKIWKKLKTAVHDVTIKKLQEKMLDKKYQISDVVAIKLPVVNPSIVMYYHQRNRMVGGYTVFPFDKQWSKEKLSDEEEVNLLQGVAQVAGLDWVETDDVPRTVKAFATDYKDTKALSIDEMRKLITKAFPENEVKQVIGTLFQMASDPEDVSEKFLKR